MSGTGRPVASEDEMFLVLATLQSASPLTLAGLSDLSGIEPRHVQAAVERMRREGRALICSGSGGYWLPATLAEAEANIARRRARAMQQLINVRGERRLLRRLQAPMMLWRDVA